MLTKVPKFFFSGGNLKQLKIRMNSISSIEKITKAMKMVAAAKMRNEVRRLEAGKNFAVGSVQRVMENESYLQKKKQQISNKKTMLVPLTSDKGLCGSINSGIVRSVKHIIGHNNSAYQIFCIGEKGIAGLARAYPDCLTSGISAVLTPVNFTTASSIGHLVAQESKDCDSIVIVYNRFKNVVTQIITQAEVLTKQNFMKQFKYVTRHEAVEPDLEYSKQYFYELYVGSIYYNCLLNNIASEQSSRMSAMQNASKNAGEILGKLTLQYSKARQAKITMELIEIISGASAL